jgi:hypothetical protein
VKQRAGKGSLHGGNRCVARGGGAGEAPGRVGNLRLGDTRRGVRSGGQLEDGRRRRAAGGWMPAAAQQRGQCVTIDQAGEA